MAASPPPDRDYPSGLRAWWLVALLCAGGFISYMHRLILSVLVVPLSADLRLDDVRMSVLQGAAFAVIYVLVGLPLGRIADVGHRLALIRAGAVVWCLGTLGCGLASGFWPLFAARCVVGIGEATLAPAAASMIADSFPPRSRGAALGVFLTGMVLGGPAAIGLGGILLAAAAHGQFAALPLLGHLAPWRLVLVVVALASLALPLALMTLREPARREAPGEPSAGGLAAALRLWPLLAPMLLALALLSVGDYGLLSWAPTALQRAFGWPPERVGPAFGLIISVAGVAGALLGGVLSDVAARHGGDRARFALTAVAGLLGAGAAAVVAAPSPYAVLAGAGLWALASGIGGVAGIAALQALLPHRLRGVGMSLVAFCNTLLGLGLGPTAVAALGRLVAGPGATALAISAVTVPAAIAAAVLVVIANRAKVA